jgi:hypothetical protein
MVLKGVGMLLASLPTYIYDFIKAISPAVTGKPSRWKIRNTFIHNDTFLLSGGGCVFWSIFVGFK